MGRIVQTRPGRPAPAAANGLAPFVPGVGAGARYGATALVVVEWLFAILVLIVFTNRYVFGSLLRLADRRTTPELNGEVVKISADRKLDEQSGRAFYEVEVFISDEEKARLDKEEDLLVPGLPAEVYIQTGSRTPLSYFLKPLTDSFARAFRER